MCNSIDNVGELECCGCRACENICPEKCIDMTYNKEGFLYPQVNLNRCIDCGRCKMCCPAINITQENYKLKVPLVYGAKIKDQNILKQSSSGGVFSAISKYVLNNNGVVFGCGYDNNMNVIQMPIDNNSDLYRLRGSKYVQSNTQDTYVKVKEFLKKGSLVYYTGTPCYIAGLKLFLGKEYGNLITSDLVCHGVPSYKLFKKNLSFIEHKYNAKIIGYDFRYKKPSCGFNVKITLKKDNNIFYKYTFADVDSYYRSFLDGKTYRICCYKCKYASYNREGDITIGDFWGIEKFHPDFYDDKGISLVIINTMRGLEIFNEIKKSLKYVKSSLENASEVNIQLKKPSDMPMERNDIYKQLDELKFKIYQKKYLYPKNKEIVLLAYYVKRFLKLILPENIKVMIKKILAN